MGMCSRCRYSHEGTGQSPEHPQEVSSSFVVFWLFLIVATVALIVWSGQ